MNPTATRSPDAAASLADLAYASLRDQLVFLEIAPGEPINEAAISAELGMGRTPVREALKRLETDRLVVSYPRRGTFATLADVSELSHITEVRRALEPIAARRAAERLTPGLREEMLRLWEALSRHEPHANRTELLREDAQVHRLIYRAADNPHLSETLVRLDNLATRIWGLVLDRLPDISSHIEEHEGLLRAILDGDPDGAERLAGEHVGHFEATVSGALLS